MVIAKSMAGALALVALAAPAAAATGPRTHTIVMERMRFGPVPAGIRQGDVILWVNRDVVPHTATAGDRSFDVDLRPRQSLRMTVRSPGAIAFYCRYHPGMRSTLTVAAR